MAKLYFKYGAMGSSKTAQALITRFNYIEMGMRVWLIKPSKDTRDGDNVGARRVLHPKLHNPDAGLDGRLAAANVADRRLGHDEI